MEAPVEATAVEAPVEATAVGGGDEGRESLSLPSQRYRAGSPSVTIAVIVTLSLAPGIRRAATWSA